MCTAVSFTAHHHYFGRTLDYETTFGEEVTVTPRRYAWVWRHERPLDRHYALIGMAHIEQDYPLYYDAINEVGLGMAGLRFAGNAVYHAPRPHTHNVAAFELIPWLLSQCATVAQARALLTHTCVTDTPFSEQWPPSPLHWLLADRHQAVVIESVADGLHVYDDPVGVLTNNPPFPEQLSRLNDYRHLSPHTPPNHFCAAVPLQIYSRGMGGLGLPGDLSSASRFVRAAFVKSNSRCDASELSDVGQFFHILGTVEQPRGCCALDDEHWEITQYTSCGNTDRGIYYYTTYDNRQITAVDMHRTDLEARRLVRYPLLMTQQIRHQTP